MRFKQMRVLVTGGGSGIGQAVCRAFAREGADVAVADMSADRAETTAQEVRQHDVKALALQVDVTQPDAVQEMVRRVVDDLGGLNILVNSAGVREIVPFVDLAFDEWQRVMATNVTGTFLCSQAAARHLIAQGQGGKIVNMASVAGLMAMPHRAAYVASKHAVVGLTKEMAMELAEHNIQVNAVAPGVVETSMTASYFGNLKIAASLRKVHPAGRWAQPEEIATLICFLASPETTFITGATFPIDGGFSAGKGF
ncbi:MAG: SDR family oxidoreductase [Candidatus Tectomicrobia bacterium]|nr:SDR family oxidoreductase [Candidatus Tectomicrobia bacterium]